MKKILVALMLCIVSIMGFRANPTINTVEVLSDSIETSIETLSDSTNTVTSDSITNIVTSDSIDHKFIQDGIIIIIKDGVSYDIVGRRIE